jgi:tryptophanyl-tRNA synthetase
VRKAVTDTETEVRYDPVVKPGVSNLLELLAAATGGDPVELAARYASYGPLKADVTEALSELLRPVRERFAALRADHGYVESVLADGAAKARTRSGPTLDRAMRAAGLLAPPGGFSA